MSLRVRFLVVGAVCSWLAATPVAAASLEGVAFPEQLRSEGTVLSLRNLALLRWKIFFKVYVAALYLDPETKPRQVLEDVPKRLEIEYFYGFSAEQFRKVTIQGIGANVDEATLAGLMPRIERLNALYREVKPGDRYALTYLPGFGTELALNGKPLGRVEGADLAAALFAIWLGEAPIDAKFKGDLLGEG